MGGIEAHVHRGPTLPRQVALADMHAPYHRWPVARCAGGHLREEAHTLAERPRLDLEQGAGVARLPNFKRILLDLVDHSPAGLPSCNRNVPWPVAGDLEGKTVPDGFTELHQLTSAGRAVGSYLDLRPLAGHDTPRLGRHRSRARALIAADVASCLQHRLVRPGKSAAPLHRNSRRSVAIAREVADLQSARQQVAAAARRRCRGRDW